MVFKYRRKFIVPSKSTLGKEYLVSETIHGEWQCSCMHWINRHTDCNHIKDARANPSKYEVGLHKTTIGLELNPTRRDSKPFTSDKKDNPSVREI